MVAAQDLLLASPSGMDRTELTLSRLAKQWWSRPRGERFANELLAFLRAQQNPHTKRSYAFGVLELWGWIEGETGSLPLPDEVSRADAQAFAGWLRTRKQGLREYYLSKDPARALDLWLFREIQRTPGVGVEELETRARREAPLLLATVNQDLGKRLACLVNLHTLRRDPSIADIRSGRVDIGLPPDEAARAGIDFPVPDQVFRYYVPAQLADRSGTEPTVAARLSALSALWRWYQEAGDNRPGAEPLLQVNVFAGALREATRAAPQRSRATRAAKTPGRALVERVLATTLVQTHGSNALQQAGHLLGPNRLPAAPSIAGAEPTFNDLRDQLAILLLAETGLRASEASTLRRRDIQGDPPTITVRGKRRGTRVIALPPASLRAYLRLSRKLEVMAAHQERYDRPPVALRLLQADAPVLPVVKHWGANAGKHDRFAGLGRAGLAMMLRRRAEEAGIEPGTEDFARIHPHGLRHLFAYEALEAGTPINRLQAMLGHSRGSQTLQYVEERDPARLISAATVTATPEVTPPAQQQEFWPHGRVKQATAEPDDRTVAPPAEPSPTTAKATVELPEMVEIIREEESPMTLIGLGEELPHPEELVDLGPEADALARVQRIYEDDWGERDDRVRLSPRSGRVGELSAEELRALGGRPGGRGGELEEEVVQEAEDRLLHVYVGRSSGLPWWGGVAGKLQPEAPLFDYAQALPCTGDEQSELCARLTGLWADWMSGRGRGPTGARSLILWLGEVLLTVSQVDRVLEEREGQWVPTDEAWSVTSEQGQPPTLLRYHETEAVVAWFQTQAWQFRRTERSRLPVETGPGQLPDYYADRDPVAELPASQRDELLDWLAALTGQRQVSPGPSFRGVTRRQIIELLSLMCRANNARDRVRELRQLEMRDDDVVRQLELRRADEAFAAAVEDVNRRARSLGHPDFDYGAALRERAAAWRAGAGTRRKTFLLRLVGELFGEEASQDSVVEVAAACDAAPLADDKYRAFFQVDPVLGTIRHDALYAREFAEELGAHSECVARRVARDLWELRQAGNVRLLQRPDELLRRVDALMTALVPCPRELEAELRYRLPAERRQRPLPVYEQFAEALRRRRQLDEGGDLPDDLQLDIAEEFGDLEEAFSEAALGELFAGEGMMLANPARSAYLKRLPAATDLLVAALL